MPAWDEITPHLERRQRSLRFSVTHLLIGLNVAGFILTGLSRPLGFPEFAELASFSWASVLGQGRGWAFFTFPFVHPVEPLASLLWFIFGCYLLHETGRRLEQALGWTSLVFLYIGACVAGGAGHAISQVLGAGTGPLFDFHAPVAALLLADAWREPDRPVRPLMLTAMRAITVSWLLIAALGILGAVAPRTGASPFALGGSVLFTLAWIAVGARIGPTWSLWSESRTRARFLEEFMVRRETDEILGKIHGEGMGSLTASERRVLKRASRILARRRAAVED